MKEIKLNLKNYQRDGKFSRKDRIVYLYRTIGTHCTAYIKGKHFFSWMSNTKLVNQLH